MELAMSEKRHQAARPIAVLFQATIVGLVGITTRRRDHVCAMASPVVRRRFVTVVVAAARAPGANGVMMGVR